MLVARSLNVRKTSEAISIVLSLTRLLNFLVHQHILYYNVYYNE